MGLHHSHTWMHLGECDMLLEKITKLKPFRGNLKKKKETNTSNGIKNKMKNNKKLRGSKFPRDVLLV